MERGSILRIEDARGSVLHVREGAVWLTQEGDPLDRYLAAGARFSLDRDGLAVAQAIVPQTTLTVTPPLRERTPGFWTRLFPA